MKTVDKLARAIVLREGGYVNDPDDPGGPTNFGVTIHTIRSLGLDLDGDGDIDAMDVQRLTIEQAVDVFKKHYFEKPRINLLPAALQPSVFDMYVNAGGNAVKILQRLLVDFGEPTTVDGALGPKTAAAIERVFDEAGVFFIDAYGIARRNYYYAIGDRRPASRKYARRKDGGKGGWIVRAEEFITTKYDYTEAEHRERVASWA